MFAYVIRRLFATIVVMTVVAFVVFSLLYLTPGDPAAVIAGDAATTDDIRRSRANLSAALRIQKIMTEQIVKLTQRLTR